MVFEILVEGFVTRLAAVYQSQDAQTIGNIRRARLADRSLTPMVRGALVYSGTSTYEKPLIQGDASDGKYIDLSADDPSGYYRVNFRPGPYDMFTSAAAMRQAMAAKGGDGPQQVPSWGFLADPDHAPTIAGMTGASVATDITIPYREDSSRVQYKYDAKTRTYGRWQNSASKAVRDVDGVNNQPVAASNVVIVHTEIWEVPQIVDAAGAHAHDMRLTGTGTATIFRDGLRQEGTWSRATDSDLFTFKNAADAKQSSTASRSRLPMSATRLRTVSSGRVSGFAHAPAFVRVSGYAGDGAPVGSSDHAICRRLSPLNRSDAICSVYLLSCQR